MFFFVCYCVDFHSHFRFVLFRCRSQFEIMMAFALPFSWLVHSKEFRKMKFYLSSVQHRTVHATLLHLCIAEPYDLSTDAVNSVTDTRIVQSFGPQRIGNSICGQRWYSTHLIPLQPMPITLSHFIVNFFLTFSFCMSSNAKANTKRNSNTYCKNEFHFKTKIIWHCSTNDKIHTNSKRKDNTKKTNTHKKMES